MKRYIVGSILASLLAACMDAPIRADIKVFQSCVVTGEGDVVEYPLGFDVMSAQSGAAASRIFISVMVKNRGDRTVVLPLSSMPSCVTSVLSVRARKQGDGEQCSYPSIYGVPLTQNLPPELRIGPRRQGSFSLDTWFSPWSAGTYEWEVTLKNERKSYWGPVEYKDGDGGSLIGSGTRPLAGAWIGEVRITGEAFVYSLSPDAARLTPEEREKKLRESDDIIRLALEPYFDTANLKDTALDESAELLVRVNAITRLGSLRHQHATEALAELEAHFLAGAKFGGDYDPVLCNAVCQGLYENTSFGTGYLALSSLISAATTREYPSYGRSLCIMLLHHFANERSVNDGDRVIHIVTEDERQQARKALADLKRGIEEEQPEIRNVIEELQTFEAQE